MQFQNQYRFLSNFQYCRVTYEGVDYPYIENAFQAAKTVPPSTELRYMSPGDAKHAGFRLKLRPDWEQVKYGIMEQLVRDKFSDKNPELKAKLIATYPEPIVEHNRWHDNEWGHCLCEKCKNKSHRNMLGLLLTKVRQELIDNES